MGWSAGGAPEAGGIVVAWERSGLGATEATGAPTDASLLVSAGAATGRWRVVEPTVKPRSKTKTASITTRDTAAATASCLERTFSATRRRSRVVTSSTRITPRAFFTRPGARMGRQWIGRGAGR